MEYKIVICGGYKAQIEEEILRKNQKIKAFLLFMILYLRENKIFHGMMWRNI